MKKSKGFTIIEMLVIIFIIGIISTTLVVNWRRNEKRYLVQRVAQEIAQNIRKAQDLALTSKKISGQEMPYGYGVFFSKDSNNFYIIFGNIADDKKYQTSDILVENVELDSQIQIDSLSSGQNNDLNILFSIPDGFTSFDPTGTSATIVIKKIGTTCPSVSCKSIIVKDTGQINIQ